MQGSSKYVAAVLCRLKLYVERISIFFARRKTNKKSKLSAVYFRHTFKRDSLVIAIAITGQLDTFHSFDIENTRDEKT